MNSHQTLHVYSDTDLPFARVELVPKPHVTLRLTGDASTTVSLFINDVGYLDELIAQARLVRDGLALALEEPS